MPDAVVRKFLACCILAALLQAASVPAQSCSTVSDPATRTKVGDQMPAFTVNDSDGKTFSLKAQRGKVVVLNFWATWCGPCKFEIPRLERDIWQQYKADPNFVMMAIAREQTDKEIVPFRTGSHFTYPIASDPKRSTYGLFAESGIPRSYVVDGDGKILFQTVGYCEDDFDRMKAEIEQALKKLRK